MVADTARRVVIAAGPSALARLVADRFLVRVQARIRDGRLAHLALTGGTMGSAVLRAVAEDARAARLDWSLVHFWWSDERFVPATDPDRNAGQARSALLDHIPVPAENIHEMPPSDAGLSLDDAASAYATELAQFGEAGRGWPSFAVCVLGVGPDGHIASLFPDRPEIAVTGSAVLPVRDSPKPPPERITLTRPVINASKRVWLVLTGAEKTSALGLALAGANYENVPAAGAKGRKRTVFFVDEAAAADVAPDLIDVDY